MNRQETAAFQKHQVLEFADYIALNPNAATTSFTSPGNVAWARAEVIESLAGRTFYVVRVNRDPLDIFAAETLEEAVELASPNHEDSIHYGVVFAPDAGAARLLEPVSGWSHISAQTEGR